MPIAVQARENVSSTGQDTTCTRLVSTNETCVREPIAVSPSPPAMSRSDATRYPSAKGSSRQSDNTQSARPYMRYPPEIAKNTAKPSSCTVRESRLASRSDGGITVIATDSPITAARSGTASIPARRCRADSVGP
ncbi:hypothetical protein MTP03_01120 [Tsukamurella sp. PLM1]|nr:hypothetical protein [Tsukamurella sp. PLM1]BDH55173.1 hypothetical protein MTP03_01120 [Tsukamurella sp. PLM1]